MSPETKYCGGCKRDRPRDAFGAHNRNRDGLRTQCRDCEAERNKRAYNAMSQERRTARQLRDKARSNRQRARERAHRVKQCQEILRWFTENGYTQRQVHALTGVQPRSQCLTAKAPPTKAIRERTLRRLAAGQAEAINRRKDPRREAPMRTGSGS